MDMGMVLQGTSPGVQHAKEARQIGADVMPIEGESFHGIGRGFEQGRVSGALVFAHEGAQFFWHREGKEEMMGWELALKLFFEPLLSLMVLASGAMAIATGAIELMGCAAAFALVKGYAAGFGTTTDDRIDGFAVCFRHTVGVAMEVLGAEGAKDFIDGGHD
jgi:hypothetical protein